MEKWQMIDRKKKEQESAEASARILQYIQNI